VTTPSNHRRLSCSFCAQQKAYQQVVAPFDGIVTRRNIDVGTLVQADTTSGTFMFTLSQSSVLRIQLFVPQDAAIGVKPGIDAVVRVPEVPGRSFPGKVTRIAVALDPLGRLTLTADGRMMSVVCDGRTELPAGVRREYSSYCGTYTYDGERLVTRVDAASDPTRIGSDQVRGVRFEGERMVLIPPPPDRRKRGTPGDHLGAHRGGVDPTRNRKFESISLQRRVSCEPDFLGSDFRKGQVAMARLVTSSCTGASRKLCGRSVVNWRASVHSGRRAEALANAEEAALRLTTGSAGFFLLALDANAERFLHLAREFRARHRLWMGGATGRPARESGRFAPSKPSSCAPKRSP
jgi:hypothetical protein